MLDGSDYGREAIGAAKERKKAGFVPGLQLPLAANRRLVGGLSGAGEIFGYDLYPCTEGQVGAVRRAIVHFEFLWDLAAKIDQKAMADAPQRADALAGPKAVYSVPGLDAAFEAAPIEQRRRVRV